MFDVSDQPRVFAQAPGVDFPRAVVEGLRARFDGKPPEALARVTLYVNTLRMKRRFTELFDSGPAVLLPKIRLVTDLGQDAAMADLAPAVSPLRRRLELATLVADLLERTPDLAPRHAIYALADSLAGLMDEMQGEGVSPDTLRSLDVSNHSAHWARSLAFLDVVERFFGADSGEPPDLEARQREVIERLVASWAETPPADPVILAGSTGSRGATALLMEAVARLPQGAVILPGFDFDMPVSAWNSLENKLTSEDHPQYRFYRLLKALNLGPEHVTPWRDTPPPAPRRNALISLALRPAPVTDQWQQEGPAFQGLAEATEHMTLIEASSPREEALAIALVLREAAENGREAVLISPDRMLTRQVTAALDRWRILPDDSAGRPLPLTAPGRLLRHVAGLRGQKLTGVDLLTLLKHPLTYSTQGRGDHLRLTRDLELKALRRDMPFPDADSLRAWARDKDERRDWVEWIISVLDRFGLAGEMELAEHVAQTREITEMLAAGTETGSTGRLWEEETGRVALRLVEELTREAPHGGVMNPTDFRDIFSGVLNRGEVRDAKEVHSGIKIWGTLEARVQGVDLVILAGLNEGTWPEGAKPDPWMNRQMRHDAGLLLPERRIGLAAHDFQQAIGASEVILSRALRGDEAETVPSRWINRLTNLMSGMSEDGADALETMRDRGSRWLSRARSLDAPLATHLRAPAVRPSPQPPVDARPQKLSFTQIGTLIRDPYAIYARKVLGLNPLDPLHQSPDAPLRGTAIHKVMERFLNERPDGETRENAKNRLLSLARDVFENYAPWPAARILWLAKLEKIVDGFLEDEDRRSADVLSIHTEVKGSALIGPSRFELHGEADRVDLLRDGRFAIYDYKTGQPPSEKQQLAYDKQLLLEAIVARLGGFKPLARAETAHVAYIGLGSKPGEAPLDISPDILDRVLGELETIIDQFAQRDRGYTARRVAMKAATRFGSDFDHLSRYGEWDHSSEPVPERVGD